MWGCSREGDFENGVERIEAVLGNLFNHVAH
jgi:hypothetical protein